MEIKLLQEFDFNDKDALFGYMDSMNDAKVKEIREDGNSLYIKLYEFDGFLNPDGEVMWPYKELEIEYGYAEKDCLYISVQGKRQYHRLTPSELLDLVKKEKAELEMNDWVITSYGALCLKLLAPPKNMRRKPRITDVEIQLIPKKITYCWMS